MQKEGAAAGATVALTVNQGADSAEVTAVPALSHNFVNWTHDDSDGAEFSTNATIGVLGVTEDVTLHANFEIKTYTVTFETDGTTGSSITGTLSQTVDHGSSATAVTAVPPATHDFAGTRVRGNWNWRTIRHGVRAGCGRGHALTPNLRLLTGSPCIDTGTNAQFEAGGAAETVTTDLDGNPRIVGSFIDIGAYEYQPD